MMRGIKSVGDKLKCYPVIKDQVLPHVQFFWTLFPFNILCAECYPWFNFFFVFCTPLCPITCPLYTLFWGYIAPAWNAPFYFLCGPCLFLATPFFFCYYILLP